MDNYFTQILECESWIPLNLPSFSKYCVNVHPYLKSLPWYHKKCYIYDWNSKNFNNATSLPPLTNYIREDIAKFTWGTRYCKQAEGCMIFHLAHEIFINVGMEMSIKRLLLSFIYTLFLSKPQQAEILNLFCFFRTDICIKGSLNMSVTSMDMEPMVHWSHHQHRQPTYTEHQPPVEVI